MLHRACASINLRALQHNLSVARSKAGESKVLAVIKANAYGHGLVPVAEALSQADKFGVTDINEAETLRAAGCDKAILILQGIIAQEDLARIGKGAFDLVVHRTEDLPLLEQHFDQRPPAAPLNLWLKMDSGMGRLGISAEAFTAMHQALKAKPWVKSIINMTHLANASDPAAALNAEQITRFLQVHKTLPGANNSIAASSALLAFDNQSDWVRPGIMLYGSSPFSWKDEARRREAFKLKAVMTLQARLISIGEHQAGDNIGYNSQFICPKPMRIGIVSIGYADGYPSTTPNGSPLSINGQRTTTVGRVSMDMLAIDLSKIPEAKCGDVVTLWGDDVSIDEVAEHIGMISYNLTSTISARVPRVYV